MGALDLGLQPLGGFLHQRDLLVAPDARLVLLDTQRADQLAVAQEGDHHLGAHNQRLVSGHLCFVEAGVVSDVGGAYRAARQEPGHLLRRDAGLDRELSDDAGDIVHIVVADNGTAIRLDLHVGHPAGSETGTEQSGRLDLDLRRVRQGVHCIAQRRQVERTPCAFEQGLLRPFAPGDIDDDRCGCLDPAAGIPQRG